MKGYLLIIGPLVVIISVLITLNVFFQQSLQQEMAEQFNNQQLLLSRSIADNIRAYLQSAKEDILLVSDMVLKGDIKDNATLESVMRRLSKKEAATAYGIMDAKGGIVFFEGDKSSLSPVAAHLFKHAKKIKAGDAIIVEANSAVYTLSPIYEQKRLKEVVFISIKIQDIADKFVSNIRSGSRGYAWIMDQDGTLLYHPTQPAMVGGNIYKADDTCFKCHKSFDLEKKVIEGKASNYGRYISPIGEDKIIAFSSVNMDNLLWIISASAPYSEVTHAIRQSTRIYTYLIVSIFITTSLISVLLIVFNKRRIKAEEAAKREQELEKYALILESKVRERTSELASEKEKLNTIVSAMGSGIVLLDNTGKILWSNEKMKEMVGHNIMGMSCEDLCADCSILFDTQVMDINTAIMSDLFGKKGQYFQVTNAPIKGANGEVHGYIRLIQDVTEMKKMEEQIVNSEKLASIGRLAAGIAHEIGNPLTSIFSFVQILREMEDSEFKKESLDTIYFHVNRISEILKQLSGFTKMPTGEASECRINDIIETSLNLIQYDKKAKNVSIVKELSPSLPNVVCSGNQLSQVFVNLTLNAMDAMPEGGTLTIKSMVKGNNIIIRFEDTGTGIPKGDITRVFDPFYTTKEKGTGLGLAVSYDIIKKMNGALNIESETGKGSVFTITLPCK